VTTLADIADATLTQLVGRLHSGEITSVEIVSTFLERIDRLDARWHAFITVAGAPALERAARFDARRRAGQFVPPLGGIPVGVKDSVPTAGIRTTANSRLLADWVPTTSAAAIDTLESAGGVVLGKTNLNEFAWALPSSDDLYPAPPNPWNPRYLAIGSSSGSGVAVAAGLAPAALGTDAGGSARLPAGQLGLVSLKPTRGRVSHVGAGRSTITEISPICRTVSDTALLLGALGGHPEPVSNLVVDVRGWRVGVPHRFVESATIDPEVQSAFDASLTVLARLGVDLVDLDIAGLADARMANFVVLNAEAHAEHASSLRRHPERYGDSARAYHWMGAFLSAAEYLSALELGRRVCDVLQSGFADVRALLTPVTPFVTAEAARRPEVHRAGLGAAFTSPFNLTGHPALVVPAGSSASTGLPIGLQLVGALDADATLLQLGHAFERATDWTGRRPTVPLTS
jgi:aspartyl-tRNA(Asn)/glutamyl-tRNA(Gln) amidotransferase subunit A